MSTFSLLQNKIFKAGGWYTITNFFLKGIGFLTIPIYTRLLSTEDYGVASIYLTWLSIFTVIIGLGLNESIKRAKFEFTNEYYEFISSITFLSLLIFSICMIIFTVFIDWFTSVTDLPIVLFYFMVFQAFLTYIKNTAFTMFRLEYRYKLPSLISITITIAGVLISIFLITSIFDNEKYIGKIIGDGVFHIIVGVVFIIYLLKRGKTLVNFKFWKFGLVFGIPLVFHNLGLIVNTQFDRIAINNYLGSSETGIYSFAYQVGMIVQVLFISIDQAWNPWFLEKYDNGEYSKIRKRAKIMRNIFTVLYTSVLMISPELVKLMADKSYWEGLYLVPWIFMGYYFVFLYALEVNVEYASKRTGMIATGTIISALINIVLNMIFVPIYGYMAAAVTTLISYVVLFIFHYVITSRIIKSKVYGIKFYLQSIIFVLFITGFFLIFQDSFLLRIFGILIAWGLLYYSLKHELKKIGKGKD